MAVRSIVTCRHFDNLVILRKRHAHFDAIIPIHAPALHDQPQGQLMPTESGKKGSCKLPEVLDPSPTPDCRDNATCPVEEPTQASMPAEDEQAGFRAGHSTMDQGWGKAL